MSVRDVGENFSWSTWEKSAARFAPPAVAVQLLTETGILTPSDPGALGSAAGVVLAVAVLAALVPANRTARVEPMRVPRQE